MNGPSILRTFMLHKIKAKFILQSLRPIAVSSKKKSPPKTNRLVMCDNEDLYSNLKTEIRAHALSSPEILPEPRLSPSQSPPSYDKAVSATSIAISQEDDDPVTRTEYRPFLLDPEVASADWISKLELSTVLDMVQNEVLNTRDGRLKVLVLYGSLRARSYSRLLAFEAARILYRLGCDVRVFNPTGLPVKDDLEHTHVKVQELRGLSTWSDGHIWVSPEQHGNLTAVFKNQIDWIPLSTGSIRPTQGRTLAIAQINGGSQSFNTVNSLRILGRWMRMFTIPNQSSIPKGYTQFSSETSEEGGSRLLASPNRDRLVDCMEEFVKYTIIMRRHIDLFGDRYSEREERAAAMKKDK